jgi:hypothetical protein
MSKYLREPTIDSVAEAGQSENQFGAREIPWQFHRLMTSSRTK